MTTKKLNKMKKDNNVLERLEFVKQQLHLKWYELAEFLGVSRQMMTYVNKGTRTFGPKPLRKLKELEIKLLSEKDNEANEEKLNKGIQASDKSKLIEKDQWEIKTGIPSMWLGNMLTGIPLHLQTLQPDQIKKELTNLIERIQTTEHGWETMDTALRAMQLLYEINMREEELWSKIPRSDRIQNGFTYLADKDKEIQEKESNHE